MIANLKMYLFIAAVVSIIAGAGFVKHTLHRVEVLEFQKKELLQANATNLTTMKQMAADYNKALMLVKKANQDSARVYQMIEELKEVTKDDEDGDVAPVLRNSLNRLRAYLNSKSGDL